MLLISEKMEEIHLNKLLIIPSIFFLILGLIGLLIPIVPQIPFFAVSIILFAAASERFKSFIISTKLYNKYLKKYIDKSERLSKFMNNNDSIKFSK